MGGRQDWVQADVRCLLCGRILGHLVGAARAHGARLSTVAGHFAQFNTFRPTDPGEPAVALTGNESFSCSACGGRGMFEEVETFTTYADDGIEDLEDRPRRGRPPKPWPRMIDQKASGLGFAG